MSNYLVSDTDLTSVANAIRTKGGTSAQLEFPTDFVSAIGAIPSGGGGISVDDIAQNLEPSGAITLGNSVTSIGARAFIGKPITSIIAPSVTSVGTGAFQYATSLQTVNMPNVKVLDNARSFADCSVLSSISFPEVERIGTANPTKTDMYMFSNAKISSFYLPNLLAAHGYYTLANLGDNSHLCTLVLPRLITTSAIGGQDSNLFRNGYFAAADLGKDFAYLPDASLYTGKLNILILRHTEAVVATYNSASIHAVTANTKVYVPSALIDSYKAASQWSTKPTSIWYAIEGSQYEHYYANGVGVFQPITANLTNCTSDNDAADVSYGEGYSTTLTADAGYTLSSVTVTMNSVDITSTAYNPQTGDINIAAVNGAIIITATAS